MGFIALICTHYTNDELENHWLFLCRDHIFFTGAAIAGQAINYATISLGYPVAGIQLSFISYAGHCNGMEKFTEGRIPY